MGHPEDYKKVPLPTPTTEWSHSNANIVRELRTDNSLHLVMRSNSMMTNGRVVVPPVLADVEPNVVVVEDEDEETRRRQRLWQQAIRLEESASLENDSRRNWSLSNNASRNSIADSLSSDVTRTERHSTRRGRRAVRLNSNTSRYRGESADSETSSTASSYPTAESMPDVGGGGGGGRGQPRTTTNAATAKRSSLQHAALTDLSRYDPSCASSSYFYSGDVSPAPAAVKRVTYTRPTF